MAESRGPERSLPERLVDERALDWSRIIGADLVQPPPPPAAPPPRFLGVPRVTPTIDSVLATDRHFNDFASHTATTRPNNDVY